MNILKPSRKLKGWIMYTVEPPLTGTFPQRPPLYNGHFLADSPYIDSWCLNLPTTATFFCP